MTISLLAAAYLFFGGAGAGTAFWAALADMRWPGARQRRASARALGVAAAFLAAGILCLVFDLGRPDQALLLFVNPTFSYLTVGTYLLTALVLIVLILLLARFTAGAKLQESASFVVLRIVGAMASLGVMVYTGLLLRDLAPIRLWTSWWLPVLFLASSLAAGAAAYLLCTRPAEEAPAVRRAVVERFSRLDLFLVLCEILACVAYLVSASGTELGLQGVLALLTGAQAPLFWGGFVVCGIAVPLLADTITLARPKAFGEMAPVFVAFAGIAGCFCLRVSLVLAGAHVVI
ncbi:MAG: polysulfide reductase NrfD [Eggerthellaceae bacterium]|nr:polysulfide reductase NrfD [Eggerthellaceae bacterium]